MTIFILAGEASGDEYGARLAKALRQISPESALYGIGGDSMKSGGVTLFAHIRDLSILGFTAILPKLFDLLRLKKEILEQTEQLKPDSIILIDFPDFNLRVAKAVHEQFPATKIFYYIPPQIWIWRKSRIQTIKKYCTAVFPLFDFENEMYLRAGVPSRHFGHPLLDSLKAFPKSMDEPIRTLGLFPGSRIQEVQSILPIMLETVKLLQQKIPLEIAIGKSKTVPQSAYDRALASYDVSVSFFDSESAILKSDIVLTKSGTINLELSFYEKPFAVVYRTSWINWFIGKHIVRLKWISLINILAKKEIVKEFIQHDAKPALLAEELLKIANDSNYRRTMVENLRQFNTQIFIKKTRSVSEEIAGEIIDRS